MGERMNKLFSAIINKYPSGYTQFLSALDFAFGPSKEIIISGNDSSGDFRSVIFKKFIPAKIVINITLKNDSITEVAPYLENYFPDNNVTKVFICENYVCNLPADSIEVLNQILK